MQTLEKLGDEQQAFRSYLVYEKRYSEHTVLAYCADVEAFFEYLKETYKADPSEKVDHFALRSWLISLVEAGIQPSSIHRKVASLRSFFSFLEKNRGLTDNPVRSLKLPRAGKRLPAVASEKQLQELIALEVSDNEFPSIRDKAIFFLLYGAGLRRTELVQLKVHDVEWKAQRLKVLGKGRKERLIPLPPSLCDFLYRYLEIREKTFPGNGEATFFLTNKGKPIYPHLVYLVVRKFLDSLEGLAKKSPHVLRHSYATHLLNSGAELQAIKELLGHSSLAATQIYMHNSIERLKKEHERGHPRGG